MSTTPVNVFGWFSLPGTHETIGDGLALGALVEGLDQHSIPFRIHRTTEPPDPRVRNVWVCGPVDRSYGPQADLIGDGTGWIFASTTLITDRLGPGFADITGARDGPGIETKGDLACLASVGTGGFAAVLLRGPQPEYRQDAAVHDGVNRVVHTSVTHRKLLPVDLSTTLPQGLDAPTAAAGLEKVLAAADVVITSRLHGAIHSLRAGQMPVLIDEIVLGGKVSALARRWDMPAYLPASRCTADAVSSAIDLVCSMPSNAAADLLDRIGASAEANLRTIIGRMTEKADQ